MQIGVYGSGYLATVISACLADFGMPVTCFDEDFTTMTALAQGTIPFFERNLNEVTRRNVRTGRLAYSTAVEAAARKSQVIFMAQDSPSYLEDMAVNLAQVAPPDCVLVILTPVPVGTAARLEARLKAADLTATVVSQPISVTQGCAVEDFNWPDRIILGTSSSHAVMLLKQIYRPLVMRGVPVIVSNHETAELVREASTAFLATKISFINELASLCERVKADAVDLGMALGLDKKIGPRCMQAGSAFGGAFVESDMDSLAQLATGNGVSLKILGAAREVNRMLADGLVDKIGQAMTSVSGKELGLLGLSFKPNTNSIVGSASVMLARRLMARGAKVRAYDPVAIPDAKAELTTAVRYCDTAYSAADGADALVLATGWPEFRALDWDRIKKLLKRPLIVDTKNLLDGVRLRTMGFEYFGVGRA